MIDPSRFIFINSGDAMNKARETEFIPRGNWAGFVLEVTGTTDTGETLLLTDIGDIEVVRDGDPRQDQSFDFYHGMTDLKHGRPNFPSGSAATAEEVSAIIPLEANGYDNSWMIRDKNEAWLNLKFDALLDTRFGGVGVGARYTLWGIPVRDTFESYDLQIKAQNFQAPSGGGRISDPLSARNILSVFIKDEAAPIIEEVSLEVDDNKIVDKVPPRTLLTGTNMSNEIESAGNDWIEIVVAKDVKRAAENISASMEIEFTGAGTAQVVVVSAVWLPESEARQNAREIAQNLEGQARGAIRRNNR